MNNCCFTIRLDLLADPAIPPTVVAYQAVSLDDVSRYLPTGAYTTFRTYERFKAHYLENHINRLEDSSRRMGVEIFLNRERIREGIRFAISKSSPVEQRVRLTLDLELRPGTLYISCEKLKAPTLEHYNNGVSAITGFVERDKPEAKLSGFIAASSQIRQKLTNGLNEVLMVNKDMRITEGLTSNFFTVINGKVWTAGDGILRGITRDIVLDEICHLGLPIHFEAISMEMLETINEAFITSSTRAILPLVKIDNLVIRDKRPGEITKLLLARYTQRIEKEVKEI